jgi:hypothetical protein
MSKAVDNLIARIRACFDYHSLYAMEDGFNSVGLTIQTTAKNKVILCKIVNSKPAASEVGTDYIFIGQLDTNQEYNERIEQKIIDFILNNASKSSKIKDTARVWRNGLRMYESAMVLESEDINYVADFIQD